MITLESTTNNNQLNVEPSNLRMLMNYCDVLGLEQSGTSPKNLRYEAQTGLMKTNEQIMCEDYELGPSDQKFDDLLSYN